MKITFLGAAHEVTGSCTLVEACGQRILIDCGMEQGTDTYENSDMPVSATAINCVLLTHAHIDHSGKIPMLVKEGFKGPIYTTGATTKLCRIMLLDSAHIQESEAEWRNKRAKREGKEPYEPLYTAQDAEAAMDLFEPCHYNQSQEIFPGVQIRFIDSGHLLGSASIFLTITENGITKTFLFSGDIGNTEKPLIRNPQKPDRADYVLVESTYGDRLHERPKNYQQQLVDVIQDTLDRGGNLVIPSFAVGRTQELLYLIHLIKKDGLIKGHEHFPVYMDSPLAIESTEIYSQDMEEYCDEETLELIHSGENILNFEDLVLAVSGEDSKKINVDKTPKIIISASGMCEAGRIRHHLKHNLWRPECTILFTGYQAEGTLGRTLLEGPASVKIMGEDILVKAKICQMEGVSSHADKKMLIDWLANLNPKPALVFVNHGDDAVCDLFAASVQEELQYHATAPYSGTVYDLANGVCLDSGNQQRLQKQAVASANTAQKKSAYTALISAGKRLNELIEKKLGAPNKTLVKMTNQINEIVNRWE